MSEETGYNIVAEAIKKSADENARLKAENKRLREYISDHVHTFIDSDEIGKLMSFEEWCKL